MQRTKLNDPKELANLDDISDEYKSALWNLNDFSDIELGDNLLEKNPSNNNFNDYLGYYEVLSDNLSRLSIDDEIENSFKEKKLNIVHSC